MKMISLISEDELLGRLFNTSRVIHSTDVLRSSSMRMYDGVLLLRNILNSTQN